MPKNKRFQEKNLIVSSKNTSDTDCCCGDVVDIPTSPCGNCTNDEMPTYLEIGITAGSLASADVVSTEDITFCFCECANELLPETYVLTADGFATCSWSWTSDCDQLNNRGTFADSISATLGPAGVLRVYINRTSQTKVHTAEFEYDFGGVPVSCTSISVSSMTFVNAYTSTGGALECSGWDSLNVSAAAVSADTNSFDCSDCGYKNRASDPDNVLSTVTLDLTNPASGTTGGQCEQDPTFECIDALVGTYALTNRNSCTWESFNNTVCYTDPFDPDKFLLYCWLIEVVINYDCFEQQHEVSVVINTSLVNVDPFSGVPDLATGISACYGFLTDPSHCGSATNTHVIPANCPVDAKNVGHSASLAPESCGACLAFGGRYIDYTLSVS